MAPNSSEETFNTLGAQFGEQLDSALPKEETEPAKEVEVEVPAQPEQTTEAPAETAQPVEQPTPVEQAGVALDVPAVTAQ